MCLQEYLHNVKQATLLTHLESQGNALTAERQQHQATCETLQMLLVVYETGRFRTPLTAHVRNLVKLISDTRYNSDTYFVRKVSHVTCFCLLQGLNSGTDHRKPAS
ncbi:hypothetical protein A8H26_00350 [Pluralibacter gergoviae]|nr:hypothetical protein A8H26_00350 [Pluralibacter gergoviae]